MTQRDIALLYEVGEDTISEINQGKTRRLEGFNFPLRHNVPYGTKNKKYCIDCGKEILYTSTRCTKCQKIASRKVKRPERNILKEEIRKYSFSSLAKKYGVSDKAISKWCIYYNLPNKKSIIKSYTDEEWEKLK